MVKKRKSAPKKLLSLNEQYDAALGEIWLNGIETNPRGLHCKEILNHKFEIDPNDNVVTLKGWETNVDYARLELLWYKAVTNRIDFDSVIKKTWEQFSDDGITVNSAYGWRLFGGHPGIGINQWNWVLKKFEEDPDSRQCVMNLNSAFDKFNSTKDFVCTIAIHAIIREGKLYWTVYMRSQDLYLGTRNDIYCFTELQKMMAEQVGVRLGTYTHICTSLHLYDTELDKLDREIR